MNKRTKIILAKTEKFGIDMLKRLLAIIIGGILIAVAYNALLIPHKLLSGGIGGIALAGQYLFHIPVYFGIFILNIPIFLWGLKELDKPFMFYSLVGTLAFIFALPLTAPYIPKPDIDIFLASVFSGLINGLGVGIILKFGASTGGLDILSVIMRKKTNVAIGSFSFYFNLIVLALMLMFFKLEIILYTFISMWVSGKSIDFIMEGMIKKKSVIIISEKNDEIGDWIMNELHRGVTLLKGEGGFTGDNKLVLNTVLNNFEYAKLKQTINSIDPKAFMYITETSEVEGRGFTIPKKKTS